MIKLSHSRTETARRCLAQYRFRYVLGLRRADDDDARVRGNAIHAALAVWHRGGTQDEAIQAATTELVGLPTLTVTTTITLLLGYFRFTAPLPCEATEREFDMPLVNPETGAASRTFTITGILDGIRPDYVVESKSTTQDIAPGSDYWKRLAIDPQVSLYTLAARHMGHDVRGVIYNVLRMPTIRPRQVPVLDADGCKIVLDEHGDRVYNRDGSPRQSGACQSRTETDEEYGDRLMADICERPEFYYQRKEIPVLSDALETFQYEMWAQARMIADCDRLNRWFRHVSWATCPHCDYAPICYQSQTVNPGDPAPAGYAYKREETETDE